MPIKVHEYNGDASELNRLGAVLSVQEVAVMWGKSEQAVRNRLMRNHFAFRRPLGSGNFMIDMGSVMRIWGTPKITNVYSYDMFSEEQPE